MATATTPLPSRAIFALAVLSLIWGYSWIATKIGLAYADPLSFSALRIGLGALCLFLTLFLLAKPWKPARPLAILGLGLLQTTGFVGFSVWATSQGGAGRTAILVFTMPLWTMLLAWPLLGERLQRLHWLIATIACAGLSLILQSTSAGSEPALHSKVLAVLSGFCWAAGSIAFKRLQRVTPLDPLSITAWQMLFGALPLVAAALVQPNAHVQWTPAFTMSIAYNAVLTTAAGWWLWVYVLKLLPTSVASLSMFAVPVIALMLSWSLMGERITPLEGFGIALLSIALLLLSIGPQRLQQIFASLRD
ncbi:MAG: EamA family transporter [Gammaproteobacteria bacterium]